MRTICFGAIAIAFALSAAPTAHAACARITLDLSTGSNDSTAGGQVRVLQGFLSSAGYLSASPNGNFGPATTAAVKAYQAAKGLPSTGFVGPLTRFAIEYQSCSEAPSGSTSPQAPASSGETSSQGSAGSITRPRAGEELMMGKSFTVKWAGAPKSSNYALVLEDSQGVTQGYVASYLGSASEYVWTIGEVEVSGANSTKRVPLGDYRVRLQDRTYGKSDKDPVSSTFRITAPEVAASTLLPSVVKADGKSAVALYGAGLFGATIYLGEWYQNPVKIEYASADGKLLVLTVPEGTPSGKYRLVMRNQYGSLDTSTIYLSVDK